MTEEEVDEYNLDTPAWKFWENIKHSSDFRDMKRWEMIKDKEKTILSLTYSSDLNTSII